MQIEQLVLRCNHCPILKCIITHSSQPQSSPANQPLQLFPTLLP
jgi:hypothetical protein